MTPQEQSMLSDLIGRVERTQLPEKDPEAQQLIEGRLGRNPDALYILAQTVLVQKYALDQAKAQMEQLRRQPAAQEQHKATSFLGSLFGHKDEPQQAPPPPRQYAQPSAQPSYTQQGGYTPVPNAGPAYVQTPAAGGGSSFLRSAATTAAGVAAGALAFEGVESLMHGFGHAAGFGGGGSFLGGGGMGMGGAPMEETVVNNYYDTPAGTGQDSSLDNAGYAAGEDANLAPQLDQADDVNVAGDDPSAMNVADDVSLDDGGSYDDSASLDDSGGDYSDSSGDDSSFS